MNIYNRITSLKIFLYFQYIFLIFLIFIYGGSLFLLNVLLLGMSCDSGCTSREFYRILAIDIIVFLFLYLLPICLNIMSLIATKKVIKDKPLSTINKIAIIGFVILALLSLVVFIKLKF